MVTDTAAAVPAAPGRSPCSFACLHHSLLHRLASALQECPTPVREPRRIDSCRPKHAPIRRPRTVYRERFIRIRDPAGPKIIQPLTDLLECRQRTRQVAPRGAPPWLVPAFRPGCGCVTLSPPESPPTGSDRQGRSPRRGARREQGEEGLRGPGGHCGEGRRVR